ncbi:hypothetical protein [Aliivibrio kagoshimensis]|uniref:hypothetical protein n=1 Tax=Aliivibrio kagoshimensis TaxID=2910230 RepID=UPI003D097503
MNDKQDTLVGHCLINTKYPPIALFDDVASPEEFDMLYAIQSLTNPRILDEVGDISLLDHSDIPFHCERGRSYAVAPFTHINRPPCMLSIQMMLKSWILMTTRLRSNWFVT